MIVLIDGSNIAHANHHAPTLTVGGRQVQAIFNTIRTVKAMREKYPNGELIVLWDGKAKHRFDLYPEYKANRAASTPEEEAEKKAYQDQIPALRKALELLGVRQILDSELEADDLAGHLAPRFAAAGRKVLLISGDRDWIQLVSPRVTWLDPIRDRTVNAENFFEQTGYENSRAFLQGKALQGDPSDNIDGVGGIGEKGAPVFLAEYGSVERFFEQCEKAEKPPKQKTLLRLWKGNSEFTKEQWSARFDGDRSDEKALKKYMDTWPGQGRLLFERNMKLMDLSLAPPPARERMFAFKSTFDIEKFTLLCERLGFVSILRKITEYKALFGKE